MVCSIYGESFQTTRKAAKKTRTFVSLAESLVQRLPSLVQLRIYWCAGGGMHTCKGIGEEKTERQTDTKKTREMF